MSSAMNWWITVLVVGNTLAMWWLIRWTARPRSGESAEGDVTGHSWDGDLQEFNNPMPRWWLWMFYITIVFAGLYLLLFPGLGNFEGILGWSQQGQYQKEMDRAEDNFGPIFAAYAAQDIKALGDDPQALKVGQRLFANYCATCHGSDARGARGFPNLADGSWLYGGEPEAIKTSILKGRQGVMPPMGAALGDDGVENVVNYVLVLSGREGDAAKAEAGKAQFEQLCAACHGADGKGNPMLGAPNLTDDAWLYGGSPKIIERTIREGRAGKMPAHEDFLGVEKSHVLAAYVYSLSNKD